MARTEIAQLPPISADKRQNQGRDGAFAVANLNAQRSGTSGLESVAQFARAYWLRLAIISGALLTPCFWHRHLEAGDLGSHLYNAWLAQLIERGQAPGLWLARQWTNILFDASLSAWGSFLGLHAAERVTTAAAVLLFFWGAFALICAISRRTPWFVLPVLAAFTYGWTFEMGFMNYYVSLGLAFAGLAIIARGRGRERLLALALVPPICLAHPLGLVLLFGAGAYIVLCEILPPRRQWYLFAVSGFLLLFTGLYLQGHYDVLRPPLPFYVYTGADQLLLFSRAYRLPSDLLLAFVAVCLLSDLAVRRKTGEAANCYRLALQLYGVNLLAALLLPTFVTSPQHPEALVGLLIERLTSVTAIFLCCVLGAMKPKIWHLAGFAAIAAVFFFLLYTDTGKIDRMETQAEGYASLLPPGQRVVATIWPFPGARIFIQHIVDRACIGKCFSYGNYEPSSAQFRVRVHAANPIVTADYAAMNAIQFGDYVVQPQELPMFEIYQCDLTMTRLCMRELASGEKNGSGGVQPIR